MLFEMRNSKMYQEGKIYHITIYCYLSVTVIDRMYFIFTNIFSLMSFFYRTLN